MKKLFILLIVFLVVPAIVFINQKNKYNKINQQTRQELKEIEDTIDRVVGSRHSFSEKQPLIVEYLDNLIKKMGTKAVLGIQVFNRDEKERIYRRFFDKLMDFRQQLVDFTGDRYTNAEKLELMQTLVQESDLLFEGSPVTNEKDDNVKDDNVKDDDEKDDDKKDIYAMWVSDMAKLDISEKDLPVIEKKKIAASEPVNEWASLDIVDGRALSPSATKRKFLAQVTRTAVGLDQLKNYIGKEFEILKTNGDMEEGTLLAVEAASIKLNVALGGGRASILIPLAQIKKAEMLTIVKTIATETPIDEGERP